MLQVWVTPGIQQLEFRRECQQAITRGDVERVAIKRDTTQAAVATAAVPLDIGSIPVEQPANRLLFQVNQVQTTVALALLAAADYRAGNKRGYVSPNPFLRVSQRVRGRSWALIWR
jgi:hypothetical protein